MHESCTIFDISSYTFDKVFASDGVDRITLPLMMQNKNRDLRKFAYFEALATKLFALDFFFF